MKKNTKLTFLWKKWGPNRSSVVAKKAPSPWKIKKKTLPAHLCGYDHQNDVPRYLLNKWFLRYLSFGILRFRKIVLHNKIINKTRSTKNQENSTHRFTANLMNHLIKFLQDRIKPWRVRAFRVCTGYNFFLKKMVS